MPGILATWCWRWGGWQFEASLGKKFVRLHLIKKKVDVVAHVCHPNYVGSINRKTSRPVQA
jgi:hypothetical protein